jgi:hypothetical protein
LIKVVNCHHEAQPPQVTEGGPKARNLQNMQQRFIHAFVCSHLGDGAAAFVENE